MRLDSSHRRKGAKAPPIPSHRSSSPSIASLWSPAPAVIATCTACLTSSWWKKGTDRARRHLQQTRGGEASKVSQARCLWGPSGEGCVPPPCSQAPSLLLVSSLPLLNLLTRGRSFHSSSPGGLLHVEAGPVLAQQLLDGFLGLLMLDAGAGTPATEHLRGQSQCTRVRGRQTQPQSKALLLRQGASPPSRHRQEKERLGHRVPQGLVPRPSRGNEHPPSPRSDGSSGRSPPWT